MEKEQRKIRNRLAIIFWINLFALLGLAFFLLSEIGIEGSSVTEQDFVLERFGIIITIAAIPLSLKLFHKKHKQYLEEESSVFLDKVKNLFLQRTMALDTVILLNYIGFYFVGALNFMYMAGIAIFVFSLCYPTKTLVKFEEQEEKLEINDNNN